MAIFAKIANFAKIASLQGATFGIQFKSPQAGDFSPVSPLHAFLDISGDRLYFEGLRNTLKIGDRSCWIVVRKKEREREREREREIKFDCFKKLVDPSKNHNFLREILNLLL